MDRVYNAINDYRAQQKRKSQLLGIVAIAVVATLACFVWANAFAHLIF